MFNQYMLLKLIAVIISKKLPCISWTAMYTYAMHNGKLFMSYEIKINVPVCYDHRP